MTPPLRTSIVGFGRLAERVYVPALQRLGAHLISVHDPSLERLDVARAHLPGVPTHPDLGCLAHHLPDLVVVACPNRQHAMSTVTALQLGAHVLCEKPLAATWADAQWMQQVALKQERHLLGGFTNRHRPEIQALAQSLRSGAIGPIERIEAGWLRQNGVPGAGTWFTQRHLSGGGALTDLGSHLIDLIVWLTGEQQLNEALCTLQHRDLEMSSADWYQSDSAHASGDVEVEAQAQFQLGRVKVDLRVAWAVDVPEDQTYLRIYGRHGTYRLHTLFGMSPHGTRPLHPLEVQLGNQSTLHPVQSAKSVTQPYEALLSHVIYAVRRPVHTTRAALSEHVATAGIVEQLYHVAAVSQEMPTSTLST